MHGKCQERMMSVSSVRDFFLGQKFDVLQNGYIKPSLSMLESNMLVIKINY